MDNNKTINILHISDLHFGSKNIKPEPKRRRKETIQAFFRDFNRIPEDWRPQIIAITGDLAWSGRSEEYSEFNEFLSDLLDITNLAVENVICCPGNHDKFLEKDEKLKKKLYGANKYYEINDIWEHINLLVTNFKNYSQNLNSIGVKPLTNRLAEKNEIIPYLFGYRIIEGICFIVLNSAWLCDWREDKKHNEADRGNLLLDKNIVCDIYDLIDRIFPKLPTIVMYHHPKDWFKYSEYSNKNSIPYTTIDRVYNMANIILNGHIHEPRDDSPREKLIFIAGTLNSNDSYGSQCYLLKIEVDNDNIGCSTVETGQYYSDWSSKGVKWLFKQDNDKPKPFNINEKYVQIERILKEKNKISILLKEIEKETGILKKNGLSSKGQELIDSLRELQDELDEKRKIITNKGQLHSSENSYQIYNDYVQKSEEIIAAFNEITALLIQIINKMSLTAYENTISDMKKNESSKRLVKVVEE